MRKLVVVALLACLRDAPARRRARSRRSAAAPEPTGRPVRARRGQEGGRHRGLPGDAGQGTGRRALPDITLDCLGGGTGVRLSGLTGTPTVINLWASWCGPCREELPLLAKADKEYGDSLRIIGIDFDDAAPDDAIELARASGVTYPQLVDRDTKTKGAFAAIAGLPWTIFVDAQGRMVATERTPFRSYADLTAAIRRHLGVTP